eukprot:SAG31_NODE_24099_length_489_cov_0.923077_1_plen_64_part_01
MERVCSAVSVPTFPQHALLLQRLCYGDRIRGDPFNTTDDALFIMDHGVDEPGKGNDALRFLTST